jgi:hypothetical protein
MNSLKRKSRVALLILMPLFLCACFGLAIYQDVKDPDLYFEEAYSQIDQIHKHYPNREGTPSHIHFLVYDASDRQLVKMELPLSLVQDCMDIGLDAAGNDCGFDIKGRYDIDWSGVKDLRQFGMGLLVEVDEEDGKILIWLD